MNKDSIKSGVMLGLISIILTVLVYVINVELMINLWFALASLVFSIALVSWFGIKYRNEEMDGFLSYGKAYGYSFVMIIVSGVISTLFTIILSTVIDPELPGILADASLEQSLEMMKSFGADPDALDDDMLDEMRQKSEDQFSVKGRLMGMIGVVVAAAVISLITAAIIKKKQPENELL